MRPLSLRWALIIASLLATGVGPVLAQDADVDQAKALLRQGTEQYKNMDFAEAQATLLRVDRSKLSAPERSGLDGLLGKVNEARTEQASAMEAFTQGEEAYKAGDLLKAKGLYALAAESKYVPQAVRTDAQARMALVESKIAAAAAAAGATGSTGQVAPAPVDQAPANPAAPQPVAAEPKPDPSEDQMAQVRLKELEVRIQKSNAAIATGNEALDAGRVSEAISSFEEAVRIAPEHPAARQALERARALVGSDSGLATISLTERKMLIRKQENEVRYAEAIKRSHEAMQDPRGPEDFAKAREEVNYAKTLIETNKSLYTDSEYRAKSTELQQRLEFIGLTKEEWDKDRVRRQLAEVQRAEEERQREQARSKREKLVALKDHVRVLREEQNYTQALDALDEILSIDPNDDWANEWRGQLGRFRDLMDEREAVSTRDLETTLELNEVRRSEIPWHQLLSYPKNWPEKTLRRLEGGATAASESEADRQTRKKMLAMQKNLSFIGFKFEDVVQFLRDVGGMSIYVNWGALQAVGIDKSTPVNVQLQNVTFEKALKTVLKDVGGVQADTVRYVIDEGVITISTKDDLASQKVTRTYDIRDLIIRVPNFAGPRISLDSDNNTSGNNGSSGGSIFANVSAGGGNNASGGGTEENLVTRQELVDSILQLVTDTIDTDSWRVNGGLVGSVQELGGQLVVTQTAEAHQGIVDLLSQLREARELLINVESRFITVNTGFLNHIGIDLDFYFNLGSATARQPVVLPPIPPGTVVWGVDPLTGARLLTAGPGLAQWNKQAVFSKAMTPVPVSMGSSAFATPSGTTVPGSIGGAVTGSAMNISGAFLDQIQVDFVINATQAHQDTRTLTAPRLTLYNGQRAYVSVGTEQAYVSNVTFVPGTGGNASGNYNRTISRVTTGSVLDVEATVSADRRYVTMTVRPQVSLINGFTEYLGVPGVPGSGLIQLPNITRQVLECTVSVPDGGTLLLGGQRLAAEVEREMGVPIISHIPILNRAFTNNSMVRDEQTLLIIVRPEIIIHREYEQDNFPP